MAEAERRENEAKERSLAAERQKRPLEDADVNTIKDAIKEHTGKRVRFSGKEQLLDILEIAQDSDKSDEGNLRCDSILCSMHWIQKYIDSWLISILPINSKLSQQSRYFRFKHLNILHLVSVSVP